MLRQDRVWSLLKDDMLREREFSFTPVSLTMEPMLTQGPQIRVVFGREPVDKPFVLSLKVPQASVRIIADGIGHFSVE